MSESLHEKDTAFRLKPGEYQHLKKQRTLHRLTPIVVSGSKIPDISLCQENSLGFRPKLRSVSCLPKTSLPISKDELSISARKSAKHVKLPAYKSYKTSYLYPCSQPPKDSRVWNPITDKLSSSKKEVTKSNDIQNQEGLHLDKCGLKTLPQVINSDQLTVLSCRQNFLSHIPDLSYLHQLEKLDLSDNRIEHISGLEKLSALRVLNLSENRVQKISGLDSLYCLEILDLHKNQINKISGIQKVHHLKKINLAYNQICHMENISGFQFLYHVNLNNNSISVVGSLIQLPSLKRLSLENNKIKRFDDVTKLFEASHLQELSLRGNPIALLPYYFETICNYLPELQMLDFASVKDHFTQMELQTFMENMECNKMAPSLPSILTTFPRWKDKMRTDDLGEDDHTAFLFPSRSLSTVKSDSSCTDTANKNLYQHYEKSKNISVPSSSSNTINSHLTQNSHNATGLLRPPVPFIILENRDLAHNSLDEKSIEVTSLSQDERSNALPPFLKRSAIFMSVDNSKYDVTTSKQIATSQTQTNLLSLHNASKSSSTSESTPISQSSNNSRINNSATVIAQPANLTKIFSASSRIEVSGVNLTLKGIEALSALENLNIQGSQINTIIIDDIDFENIIPYLHGFHVGFPFLQTIELHHTNIGTFRQLDALVQVRNLENLMIGPDNPIVHLSSWMLYLVHRMAHLHLKTVNGKQVTVEMHQAASQMFGPVMQLMRSTFQKRRLSTILSEAQGHHTLLQSKEENPPDDFDQQTNDCGQFSMTNCSAKATQVNVKADEISKEFVEEVMTKSFQALWKQRLFHLIWPNVLSEVIVETLLDFQDIDHHVKDSLDNLRKYVSCSEMEL